VVLVFSAAIFSACGRGEALTISRESSGGRAGRAPKLLRDYGCTACHTIPAVRGANADVGPPLSRIGRRSYLAGRIQNTPENMYRWIRNPESVDERSAMPNTGVSDRDARDIVAYLYTLR
jgi:cytochrome c1